MTSRRTTLAWLAWAATVPVSGCAHAGAYEDFFKAIELDNGAAISDLTADLTPVHASGWRLVMAG